MFDGTSSGSRLLKWRHLVQPRLCWLSSSRSPRHSSGCVSCAHSRSTDSRSTKRPVVAGPSVARPHRATPSARSSHSSARPSLTGARAPARPQVEIISPLEATNLFPQGIRERPALFGALLRTGPPCSRPRQPPQRFSPAPPPGTPLVGSSIVGQLLWDPEQASGCEPFDVSRLRDLRAPLRGAHSRTLARAWLRRLTGRTPPRSRRST
jgi:hypothetical protein